MAVLKLPGIVDDDALECALRVKRSLASMESDQYLYLLEYLDECAADPKVVRLCGAERVHPYGGDGTPDIPEFAVCEIAAALGLVNRTASRLVADMLDLRHRLPLLFQCLQHGDVEAWRVRNVAAATRELSLAQVTEVDVRLSGAGRDGLPVIARMSRSRVAKVVEQYRCTDDDDNTEQARQRNLDDRHVTVRDGGDGVDEISAVVSAAEGRRLVARVDQIAGWLGEVDAASGAETRSKDVRRSVALVMLGEPAQVADLEDQIHALRHGQPCTPEQATTDDERTDDEPTDDERTDDERTDDERTDDEPAGESEPCGDDRSAGEDESGGGSAFRRPSLSATVLYLHLDATAGRGRWTGGVRSPVPRRRTSLGIRG